MIGKFKLPDNGIPIRVGDAGFIYKDVYHPIEWYGGEPYRPRVETLVLNKTCDRVFMDRGEGNHYRIPGGSIDPDSTYDKQAENETNEEALIRVTNVFFTGVVYHQPMDRDYLAKGGDGCVPYVGSTNRVYTAIYAGTIDRSTIEEKDLDDHMAKNGKFYEIPSVIDILRVGHIQALINSERIKDKKILSLLYGKLNELTMKEPMSTVFESRSTETAETETKYIYHGCTYDIDVFHPMSLDLGNGEQEPGWSTFCFYSFELARRFALMRLIQKYLGDSKDPKRKCNWDLKKSMPYLHHSVYAEVLSGIANEKFYVYTIDATPLHLGVGNDERFPEVTFREDGVIPYKKTVCYTDEDSVTQDIEIISENPDVFEKKQMDRIENLNRGWKTCMLNRDYSGDSAVAKLTKAVSDGELKPGDDVNAYMNEHGISLKDISFLERIHDAKAVQEAFDVSDEFEETILLGDHRALRASEWKCGDSMGEPEEYCNEDGLYLPKTLPDNSRIIHKEFFYEIDNRGGLSPMGQYEITLWDDERIPKPAYFLRVFVYKPYRRLGIGSVIAGYITRYQKKEKIDELIVKVANPMWGITGIRNWIRTFTSCGVVHIDNSVIVRVNNVSDVATESCEQNLSNLSWYHAEMARSGFDPKTTSGGWDEELYSKDIDHALRQAFMSAVASNKELLKEKKFTLYMYTAGEELSAIYLGKVTMYYYGLEDNGYIPKFDWEWAEQEEFSDAFLSNLREEVHPALENLIIPEKNLEVNVDKWGYGNPLWITGASGDGKTTLAKEYKAKYKDAIIISTDLLLMRLGTSNEASFKAKREHVAAKKIHSDGETWGMEFIDLHPELPYGIDYKSGDDERMAPYFVQFFDWILGAAVNHPVYSKRRIIVEGCHITYMDPKKLENKPLIIMGGSTLRTIYRRIKRKRQAGKDLIPAVIDQLGKINMINRLIKNKETFRMNMEKELFEQVDSYKPGKRLSLSNFKAIRANYNTISKYKGGTSSLKWIEPDNVSDGCVWLDLDGKFVGACTVAKDLLDKFNEITAIEVSNEYKCHGLGRQILDYAVKTLKGNALMVEYDNLPALSLYKQYGFKISTSSKIDVDSGARHSYFMYLPSRISPADKKFADEVRIGPDPAVVETVEDMDGDDTIVEEGATDSSLAPIFIVCTFTGTPFGKVVTKIQHCKFSHSGLALDSKLKKIYTFNMMAKKDGGAGIESIDMYKNVSTGGDGDVCVLCFFVPDVVKERVRQTVDYVFSNVSKTKYAFGNLLNILANRAVDTKDSLKMVCSQFVDYCLKAANIDITNKSSNLVSPNDFANIPKKNPKVFVLFDGKKSEYSSKKTDGKIHRLLRTREPEELNVVAEGSTLLEFSMKPVSKTLKLYHGSTEQGLKYIDPKQESFNDVVGKRDLVYASDDPRFSACFAVKWHDDVARQGSWDNWNTVIFGISDKVDLNRPCSMYELENDGTFIQVKTKEFIADHPIKVKKETKYRTGREMLRELGVEVITLDEYERRLNHTMESLDSKGVLYESVLPHRYFYHLVPKGANLSKGITTLQYQYDSGDTSSFRKNAEKYRERLCSQWGIYNKSPKDLTDKEIIQGINQFRGDDDGANRIYLFLYPPYMGMGPEMKKVLQGKDIYRIDLNNPITRRYIDSIDWGYEESNTAKRALTIFDYNMTPEEYFSDYTERDDRLLFSHMNHIAIIPKNGYIPKQCWEKVVVPNQLGDVLTECLCPVEENVIFNKDNTVYNIDKFESGKNNVLLVTGLSGSGKSTIAEEYARKYKAEWIELDIFEQCHGFTDQSLKEAGEVFYDYLSSHKSLWEKLKSKSIKGKELGEEINKFVHYCFAWCRDRKDKKWVIEGVQIYSFLTADEVKGFPLIIMGTSMKNSVLQRFKRNGNGKIEWGKELKNEFPNLIQWYWGEEKYLKSFEKEVRHVNEFTLPDGFKLPEQGDFDQYRGPIDLEDARNSIPDEVMEGWLAALMEAGKDSDGLPSLGKDNKTGDYSADAEKSVEQDAETPTETNDEPDEEGDDSTDYTEDADSDDDTEAENTGDDAGGEVGSPDDTGTDYTDDAGTEDGAGEEPMDTQPEQQTDTQSGNNGVKNCTLLTDFESLYRLASEISETIEPIIMEKPIQNKVLTQVRSNLSAIKTSIMNFITLHFKADDYAFNLYYYEIFIGLLSKNLEMLEKNRQFSSTSKTNGKKDKE